MAEVNAAIRQANAEQCAASDPSVSAFVAASAGSGKTKLLTDRLLRLMLGGAAPGRILCLTYTKAAAAEMAIRLNTRLGDWVVMPEPELNAALAALDVKATRATSDRARKLFADVLDLPGGMRIETIHAFCQSLLRRFPLEAGLSPHFELADEADAAPRLREARELVLADPAHRADILALASETDEHDFAALTAALANDQHDAGRLLRGLEPAAINALLAGALGAGDDRHDDILRAAVEWERHGHVGEALRRLHSHGNKRGRDWALKGLEWLAHEAEARFLHWVHWIDCHFTQEGKQRTLHNFYGAAMAAEEASSRAEITAEFQRVSAIEEKRKAAKLFELNQSLLRLVGPILASDAAAQKLAARVGYGDLIAYASQLLVAPGAAWILYKLDGGLDHLLLDEVQDTAPRQWAIAHALVTEFFAGAGARDTPRSFFAVGDEKQSIFSFQGADLASFQSYRGRFRDLARGAGRKWLDGALSTSFRSTAPVLALVDAVFADGPARDGVCAAGEVLRHGVSRVGQAGAATLWPLTEPETPPPAPAWAVSDHYASTISARERLASRIADHIGAALREQRVLPSRDRAATPGDFLILVRRRDALVTAITSALKGRDIPVAGLDRMVLPTQPAVADLLALCDALLLPEDDLAFGTFLASPLGGLSELELMNLAVGRTGGLAAALYARRESHPATHAFFDGLRNRIDYLTPHALLAEALGPLGGRARLLARFGAEAAEPLDELLAEALAFTRREPAAMQSFVHWLRASGQTIKREAELGDVVRIMTVHGAKGLQAPIVILPDTTGLPNPRQNLFWLPVPQQDLEVPVFCPRASLGSERVGTAAARAKEAARAEQNRLLYVALTRAEDELIVCGAAPAKKLPETCWYEAVRAGFARLDAVPDEAGVSSVLGPQSVGPDRVSKHEARPAAALPGWAGAAPDWRAWAPVVETARPEPLAPSRAAEPDGASAAGSSPLGGAMAAARAARAAALAKGRAVHALLQHLPDLPVGARDQAARRYLQAAGLADGAAEAVRSSVMNILAAPRLQPLFAAGSRPEVPLTGVVNGVQMAGQVDRLGITATEILLADYKTDRAPPDSAAEIAPGYLRQLAAYRAILTQIFPGRTITCLLIFTETSGILPVPPALLDSHAPGAASA